MTTLVLSIDRDDDVRRKTGVDPPVLGWADVHELVTDIGLSDPEDSGVNRLLETLRISKELEADGESVVAAAISGTAESIVGSDRSVAKQIDEVIDEVRPDGVIIVIDSVEDERLVPIIESRVHVDSVDRVVVRQAHDLESTYYLLKQFLADEELRGTVLNPIGVVLVAFPILLMVVGIEFAIAVITASIGAFLLYKGLGIDDYLEDLPRQAQDAFYSGRVSIVIYVVAVGMTLVGAFAGALAVPRITTSGVVIPSMAFVYYSIPWLALAALAASTGRLFDEVIQSEDLSSAYLNLPFGVIATGIVIRGFSAYFLQRGEVIAPLFFPELQIGTLAISRFPLTPEERLAVFVIGGVLVSLVGVRVASFLSRSAIADHQLVE